MVTVQPNGAIISSPNRRVKPPGHFVAAFWWAWNQTWKTLSQNLCQMHCVPSGGIYRRADRLAQTARQGVGVVFVFFLNFSEELDAWSATSARPPPYGRAKRAAISANDLQESIRADALPLSCGLIDRLSIVSV